LVLFEEKRSGPVYPSFSNFLGWWGVVVGTG